MTVFQDNIYSGTLAATSAASSISRMMMSRTHRFATVGGTTPINQTGTLPQGASNFDMKLFILTNGSATVSDKITVSAGGVNLGQCTAFGSASGVLRQSATGLGALNPAASAGNPVAGAVNSDLSYTVTYLPSSASNGVVTELQLMFTRVDTNF